MNAFEILGITNVSSLNGENLTLDILMDKVSKTSVCGCDLCFDSDGNFNNIVNYFAKIKITQRLLDIFVYLYTIDPNYLKVINLLLEYDFSLFELMTSIEEYLMYFPNMEEFKIWALEFLLSTEVKFYSDNLESIVFEALMEYEFNIIDIFIDYYNYISYITESGEIYVYPY